MYAYLMIAVTVTMSFGKEVPTPRRPDNEAELRYWLENMVGSHRFSVEEASLATGLAAAQIEAALKRYDIRAGAGTARRPGEPLLMLPYPGGRHPRIGFRDGAVDPQRETKISVFPPWKTAGYVVLDVPEAIFSNLGLIYLAHTHVPTIWTERGIKLDPMEWDRSRNHELSLTRRLPNGIEYSAHAAAKKDVIKMSLKLKNGTKERLGGLRVQVCAMLKGLDGFTEQSNENKVFRPPYAACRSADGTRWVIMAWTPNHRTWGNPPCPCLHSDPIFPDCEPGATVAVDGRLWFFEGRDIDAELERLDRTGWRKHQ